MDPDCAGFKPRYGYGVIQEVARLSEGGVMLQAGTLYAALATSTGPTKSTPMAWLRPRCRAFLRRGAVFFLLPGMVSTLKNAYRGMEIPYGHLASEAGPAWSPLLAPPFSFLATLLILVVLGVAAWPR